MKQRLFFLRRALAWATLLIAAAFTACGSDDDDPPADASLVLVPSATTVKTGEQVTFTVTDNGADVTARSQIFDLTTGDVLTGAFSTQKPGSYQFAAIYDNRTSPSVTVTVQSSTATTDAYFRHVLVLKFTGTWCTYCPNMTAALETVEEAYPGRMIIMAMHSGDSYEVGEQAALANTFKVTGLPTSVFDYRETSSYSVALLKAKVKRSLNEFPAVCGVALASRTEGGKVKIDATVRFQQTGDYKICCAVTEDGIHAPGTSGSRDGYYHHVTRAFATSASGDDIGNRTAGEEYKRSFEIEADDAWTLDKCHVVVYVFDKQPGENTVYYVNNAATCPVDGSADFAYEPTE